MYIRPCYRRKNGKHHAYWSLVESYRTSRGPRQRTVAYLGELDESGRLGLQAAAEGREVYQGKLFEDVKPRWVEVDTTRVRVEDLRDFGGYWLGMELLRLADLDAFLSGVMPPGREEVPWSEMAKALILCRLNLPSSELYITEHLYASTALESLLGIAPKKVDDNRLYRALDHLLPHKSVLEQFLKARMGELFGLDYDLILYDVTSTYFEGEARKNSMAQRGYSRDHRPDTKQVCIALAVSREGIPLGYEVFAGNRQDVTTLQEVVATMEGRYGRSNRIWCLDRGMISEENLAFLREEGRRYIVGTPRGLLKRFERMLKEENWEAIREGLEVKRCPSPDGQETFILCRSRERKKKEQAIHERFERRIEEGLQRIQAGCRARRCDPLVIAGRVGHLLGKNSRSAGLFDVKIQKGEEDRAILVWQKVAAWREWARQSEGCYILRSNVNDWEASELWRAYIQLTEAENAFRIQKSDLTLRPVWHQKGERVLAHILVCFLAYVLWKLMAQLCKRAGLGEEPRRVFDELAKIKSADVVLPTKSGHEIRLRCVTEPTPHQKILLQRLNLHLPKRLNTHKM